jgi:hypothetical protein
VLRRAVKTDVNSLSASLQALVFSFTSVKSHRLLGSTNKQFQEVSQLQHSWPLRTRVLGLICGLQHTKKCDWTQAERLIDDGAQPLDELTFLRAFLLLARADFTRQHAAGLVLRARDILLPAVKGGHFFAGLFLKYLTIPDSLMRSNRPAATAILWLNRSGAESACCER